MAPAEAAAVLVPDDGPAAADWDMRSPTPTASRCGGAAEEEEEQQQQEQPALKEEPADAEQPPAQEPALQERQQAAPTLPGPRLSVCVPVQRGRRAASWQTWEWDPGDWASFWSLTLMRPLTLCPSW